MMTSNRSAINNGGNYVLCERTSSRDKNIPYFAAFEKGTLFAKHSFMPREICENLQKPYIESPVIRHVSKYFTLLFSENIGACFSVL